MRKDGLVCLEKLLKSSEYDEEKIYVAAEKGELDFFVAIKKGSAFSFIKNFLGEKALIDSPTGKRSFAVPEKLIRPVCQKEVQALLLSKEDCKWLGDAGQISVSIFPGALSISEKGHPQKLLSIKRGHIPGLYESRRGEDILPESQDLIRRGGLVNEKKAGKEDYELLVRASNPNVGENASGSTWASTKLFGFDKTLPEEIREQIETAHNDEISRSKEHEGIAYVDSQGQEDDRSSKHSSLHQFETRAALKEHGRKNKSGVQESLWKSPLVYEYSLGVIPDLAEEVGALKLSVGVPIPNEIIVNEGMIVVLEEQFNNLYPKDEGYSVASEVGEGEEQSVPEKKTQEIYKLDKVVFADAQKSANEYVDCFFDDIEKGQYQPPDDLYALAAVVIYSWRELLEEEYGDSLSKVRVMDYLDEANIDAPDDMASVVRCDHAKKRDKENSRAVPVKYKKLSERFHGEPWKAVTLHRVLMVWSVVIKSEINSKKDIQTFVEKVVKNLETEFETLKLTEEPIRVLIDMFSSSYH